MNAFFTRKFFTPACFVVYMFVVAYGFALTVYAGFLSATPAVVDLKGKPRDILKVSLVIENRSGSYVELYPFINNISTENGEQVFLDPANADNAVSLANWIELSRSSIMLKSGEKKSVDFLVNVNLRAPPGIYHAVITFSQGSNRAESEGRETFALSVPVNVEIPEDIKEKLKLKKFVSDKIFFSGFPVGFSIDIENIGNRAMVSKGEIRIYDRRGSQVATVTVGTEDDAPIEPGKTASINGVWEGPEINPLLASVGVSVTGWGKYKALLDIEYGNAGRGTLNDTVFFWVVSWHLVTLFFLALAGSALGGIFWLHRRRDLRYDDSELRNPEKNK